MIVYLSIFAVLVALAFIVDEKEKYPVLFLLWIFLIFFVGGRFETGCDFSGYLNRYINILYHHDKIFDVLIKTEAGFELINLSMRLMGFTYVWLIFFCSVIIITCFVVFCGYFKGSLYTLALLFPVMIIQLGMSGIRQAMAVGFLMIAAIPFVNGYRIWTGISILVGAQFHASAIIFLPMALLAGRKIEPLKVVIAVLIFSPLILILIGDRIDTYQNRYVGNDELQSSGALIRYGLILVPAAMYIYKEKYYKEYFPGIAPLVYIYSIIGVFILIFGIVNTVALHRMIYYIMPFSILISIYIGLTYFKFKNDIIPIILPFFMYGSYMIFWFNFSSHAERCYIPYSNFILS